MPLPLDFQVRIDESGFQEHFFARINRQARGAISKTGGPSSAQRRAERGARLYLWPGLPVAVIFVDLRAAGNRTIVAGRARSLASRLLPARGQG